MTEIVGVYILNMTFQNLVSYYCKEENRGEGGGRVEDKEIINFSEKKIGSNTLQLIPFLWSLLILLSYKSQVQCLWPCLITVTSGIYPLAYSLTSDRIGPKIKKAIRNLLMIPAVSPRHFISILPPALV